VHHAGQEDRVVLCRVCTFKWRSDGWRRSGGRCHRFEEADDVVFLHVSSDAESSALEQRLGCSQVRVFREEELDHRSSTVGGCPDERVFDDQLGRQQRAMGADPLDGRGASAQAAVGLEVVAD
jgi:hypothetical protein